MTDVADLSEAMEVEITDRLGDLALLNTAVSFSQLWQDDLAGDEAIDGYSLRVVAAGRELGGWTRPEWRQRLVGWDSPVFAELSQQFIVTTYARWEHNWRPALAKHLGEPPVVDLFGDLRHLRHDVLHHNGVATSDHAGKCKLLNWFSPGDVIGLTSEHMAAICDHLADCRLPA